MKYTVIPRAVVLSGRHIMLVRSAPGALTLSAGRWHLPGGGIRSGESPQKAVARVVAERSGLRVEVGGCVDALVRRGADPETGRPAPLLHVYFLCKLAPDADPALIPGGGGAELLGTALLEDETQEETSQPAPPAGAPSPPGTTGRRKSPPLGADWGWTDLASGLAALKHDVVGPEAARYIEELISRQPSR